MARRKYSIDRQEEKEPLFEYAAGLFGDSPENLKSLMETICQQILEAEVAQHRVPIPLDLFGCVSGRNDGCASGRAEEGENPRLCGS